MIDKIKLTLISLSIVSSIIYCGYITYDRNHIENEFKLYKESINDQVQAAKIEARKEQERQNAKYANAVNNYYDSQRNLRVALERLRDHSGVLRERTVFVPGNCESSMPSSPENTGRAYTSFATRKGTCDSDFYADALMDIQQCKALIEFVK